jgi:predicted DNA-binding transcriptional regulator AlpA
MIYKFPTGEVVSQSPPAPTGKNDKNPRHQCVTPPRCLDRTNAAAYIAVSPSLFDELVKDGRMPPPIRINAKVVWDRLKLDAAIDDLQDNDNQANAWDKTFGDSAA